jgi:uncharacterized protein YdeI (YjbR/CyaY-like superfamily)
MRQSVEHNGGLTPRFFRSRADFRRWLERHHATARELWVGFYKKDSGKGGIGYKEAVDEALCFGWIDGVKKRVDDDSYMHRFTPRTQGSSWSVVNTRRMNELIAMGLAAPAGRTAFERRDREKTNRSSLERERAAFDAATARAFKADAAAWQFFRAQPPGYQKLLTFWVMSAKQAATRLRRLAVLVRASAEGKRLR